MNEETADLWSGDISQYSCDSEAGLRNGPSVIMPVDFSSEVPVGVCVLHKQ